MPMVTITQFSVYSVLLYCIYQSTLFILIHLWGTERYNYCSLLPFIVAYIIWEKRKELSRLSSQPTWLGLIPFGIGVFLYWLGMLGELDFTLHLSIWFIIVGITLGHLGREKTKTILFPIFFMLSMIPFPNFIYQKISFTLKLLSSLFGVEMMRILGISAHREGNVIDLGYTQLQVVDACSGLRYLIPLIVLGILLAYFFKAAWWKKAVLIISTLPISVIVNSLRIASVGILYPILGKKVVEGFFHDFSGWFIFMLSFGLLLMEMWILKKVPGLRFKVQGVRQTEKDDRGPKLEGGENRTVADVEGVKPGGIESERVKKKTTRQGYRAFFKPPQFLVVVIILGSILALSQNVEYRQFIPIKKAFDKFPLNIGEWTGTRGDIEERFLKILHLSDYIVVDFKNKKGKIVDFYIAYYESQRRGKTIHSPQICLRGSGWGFKEFERIDIQYETTMNQKSMPVKRVLMVKSGSKRLCYYWYPQRGRILTNAYQLKIYVFWDALTRQRTDGALVRLITPVYEDEEIEDSEIRLQGFMREVVPVLDEFLPE